MTLLIKSTTIVFYLKINFIIIAITIVNIAVNKFNFVMMNMRFISTAINTHYTILKMKNKRSTENLNENCIYQKLNSHKIAKN